MLSSSASAAPAANPTLIGKVGFHDRYSITLTFANGRKVKSLPAGTYRLVVHDYSAMPNLAIPDNDQTGVSSTISATDTGTIATVKVTTDITHTYRGDLRLTVSHGSVSKVIFDGTGGSAHDLKKSFDVSGFSGDLGGDWTLLVQDTAAGDVGTLNAWQLEVTSN